MSKIVAHKDVLPPCSVLNVTIKEARNLAAKDRGGTSDPYCIITLGGKNQVKTKYIEKTLNPVWNEKFNFVATRQSEYLHVVVKDKNRITKDVFLGQVSFPVSDFYEKQSVDRWCPLLKRTTKCKISGDIHILVSLRIPNVDWTVKEVSDLSGAARKPSMVRQVTKTSGSGRSSSLSSLLKSDADENKDKDNKGKDKTDKGKDKGKDKSTGSLVASKGKGKVTEKEDDSAKEKEKEKEKVKAEDTAETEEEKARKAEERRKRKEQRRKERAERRRLQEERERKEQEEFERQERLALLEQEITDVQQIYDVPQTCVKKMKWEPVTRHLSLLLFSNDQRIVTLKIHIPKDYPEDRPQITLEGALGNFKPGIVEAFVKYGNEYASDRFKALADILNFFISNFDKKFNSGRMLHLSAETGTKDLTRSAWLTASMQIGASFRPEQDEEDLEAVIDEEDTENWEETPCFLVRDGANALELHVYQVQAMFGAKSVALVREANEVTLFLDTGYLDSTMADALAIDTSKPICVTLTFDPSYIFSDELPKVRVEQQGSSFFPLAAQLRDIMRVFLRKCWPLRMDDQQSLIEKLKCRTGTEPEIEALREQDKNFLKETYVIPDVDSQSTPSSSSGSSSASSSSPPISATNTPTPPPPPPVSTVSKSATTQVPIPAPPVSISLSSTPTTRTNAQFATGAIHKKTWSDDSSDSDTDSGWPSDESSTDSEVEPESESTTSSEADREEDEETKQRKETAQTLTQLGDFPLPLCIHALKQCRDDVSFAANWLFTQSDKFLQDNPYFLDGDEDSSSSSSSTPTAVTSSAQSSSAAPSASTPTFTLTTASNSSIPLRTSNIQAVIVQKTAEELEAETRALAERTKAIKELMAKGYDQLAAVQALEHAGNKFDDAFQLLQQSGASVELSDKILQLQSSSGVQSIMNKNFLALTMYYMLHRVKNCTNFCTVCDERLPSSGVKPVVCADEKCVFRFTEMGLGSSVTRDLAKDPDYVDLMISMTLAAACSSRNTKILYPFPLDFMGSSTVGSKPTPQTKASQFTNLTKDFTALQRVLNMMPSVDEMLAYKDDEMALKQFLEQKEPRLYRLLRWILSTNRAHLQTLPKHKYVTEMGGIRQFLLISNSPEKEAKFRAFKRQYGSVWAFHGSSLENWHAILRTGLRNLSNTDLMTCGAAYGAGIYLSPHISTSRDYAPSGSLQWSKSRLGTDSKQAVAICEIAKHPILSGQPNPHYVVPNEDLVTTRFLCVFTSGSIPYNIDLQQQLGRSLAQNYDHLSQ